MALPTAWGAVRVDADYARGREYSGLPFGRRLSLVLARAWRGPTTAPREGGEAQAGVETHEGGGTLEGGTPFFVHARCGAPCLAPNWTAKRRKPEGAPRPECGSTRECESTPERSVEGGPCFTPGADENSEGRLFQLCTSQGVPVTRHCLLASDSCHFCTKAGQSFSTSRATTDIASAAKGNHS